GPRSPERARNPRAPPRTPPCAPAATARGDRATPYRARRGRAPPATRTGHTHTGTTPDCPAAETPAGHRGIPIQLGSRAAARRRERSTRPVPPARAARG